MESLSFNEGCRKNNLECEITLPALKFYSDYCFCDVNIYLIIFKPVNVRDDLFECYSQVHILKDDLFHDDSLKMNRSRKFILFDNDTDFTDDMLNFYIYSSICESLCLSGCNLGNYKLDEVKLNDFVNMILLVYGFTDFKFDCITVKDKIHIGIGKYQSISQEERIEYFIESTINSGLIFGVSKDVIYMRYNIDDIMYMRYDLSNTDGEYDNFVYRCFWILFTEMNGYVYNNEFRCTGYVCEQDIFDDYCNRPAYTELTLDNIFDKLYLSANDFYKGNYFCI